MSNNDGPAGSPGGPVTAPVLDDLPEKMRVHALAKLLGRTSKEVLGVLAGLGLDVRGAQSSIDRKVAEQVVTAFLPEAPAGAREPEPDLVLLAEPVRPVVAAPVVALTPIFAPPTPLFQEPARPAPRTRRRAAAVEVDEEVASGGPFALSVPDESATGSGDDPRNGSGGDEAELDRADVDRADVDRADVDRADLDGDTSDARGADDADDDEDGAARRRRRRGRRGRGRGRGGEDSDEESADGEDAAASSDDGSSDDESDEVDTDESDQADGDASGSRRRRRRRRRRSGDETDAPEGTDDDPPGTVTRVRRPREARAEVEPEGDGVQSVRGSTRLEAKRQRRRDGRDAGRRRVPILSESEFLARRESVDRSMVVRERGDRIEIAVLEDDVLVEHFIGDRAGRDGGTGPSMVGNIYLGRVQNVLPSMEAAFIDIGRGRNAVLYAGEVDWDAAGLGGKARRIEQALSSGDPVLVQVTKDPIGHKGARLTTQISLAGRFLVYVPSGGAAGISRKLPDVERKRLKDMLREIVPSEAGVIIRTASEGVSHEALERDVRRLQVLWDVVRERSEKTGPNKPKAPVLLYEEPDLLVKVVRDQFNEDFSRLVVEGDDAWDTLHNYLGHVAPELADRIHRHTGGADVFSEYRIDEQLLKALDRKVWLPSGGTLVIDRTEAMTVVDVNTGKYTGSGGNLEETVTRNNLEAAEEIVRQLRLRDIGGIIVIDFIDMVLEANRDLVLRRLTECLSRDRTRHQVAEVTSLGLVQMTRKRVGGGLLEHFSTPCEHCRGRGVILSAEPVIESAEPARSNGGGSVEGAGRRSRGRGRGRDGDGDRNGGSPNGRGGAAPAVTAALVDALPTAVVPMDVRPTAPVVASPAVVASAAGAASPAAAAGPAADPVAVVPAPARPAVVMEPAEGVEEPELNGNGRPARRRGRVTRTAGAPAASGGDTPAAAVVTVPAVAPAPEPVSVSPQVTVPAEVPAQPEPTVTTRPRRTRRAASRPAGPPAPDAGGDPV